MVKEKKYSKKRGKFIVSEEKRQYVRDYQHNQLMLVFLLCIFLFLQFGFVFGFAHGRFSTKAVGYAILVSSVPLILLIVSYWQYVTRTRIKIYERGFISGWRPYKYAKEGKTIFVQWEDVIRMKRENTFKNPNKWLYKIRTKNEIIKGIWLPHYRFGKNAPRVLKKLEEIETQFEPATP